MQVLAVEFLGMIPILITIRFLVYYMSKKVNIYVSGIPPLRFALATIYCDIREECKHIPGAERVYL